jgi:dTDP-4-dehydrorhamnose reductase
MQAIREVNPQAQCIQNDDLGKTFSTPLLRYQAEFENERRWLSWDLLCGHVTPDHPLWDYLRTAGISEAELWWFGEHACPPDIIGMDYYLTSERFLDEQRTRYPADLQSGNGQHEYADVPAVRVRHAGLIGPAAILREAWERYHLPVAITEAHNGCTREEQLRWLRDMWQAAHDARQTGVDVRAVTAWSVFGSYDWNSLVTRDAGYYEPGVYDVRGPTPRATAITPLLQDLAAGRALTHPVLQQPGWWQRPLRFLYGVAVDDAGHTLARAPSAHPRHAAPARPRPTRTHTRPLLIVGAGMLGRTFARLCELRGLPYRVCNRRALRHADAAAVHTILREWDAWAVVNTVGYERIDAAERDVVTCVQTNANAAIVLAAACAAHGVPLLTFSSDLVFDGQRTTPYVESDPVGPLGVYGRSKALAEKEVLETLPQALVVRAGACFGPGDRHTFVAGVVQALVAGQRVRAADDLMVSPTYVPDLVHAALDLLIDGERGVWHVANAGALTWADFARCVATVAGYNPAHVDAQSSMAVGWTAPRPRYSVLGSERGTLLPALDDALARYGAACGRVTAR